jgi:hypothetical protein
VNIALRNYSLRVPGAADRVDEYRGPLSTVSKQLGSRFFTARADGDDLVVNVVFSAPGESTRDALFREATQVLPSELHERLVLNEEPDRPHEISAQLLEDKRHGRAILPGALQAPEDLSAWDDFLARTQPRGLIELGTGSGSFSRWLSERVQWFKTIDLGTPDPRTPGFVRLNVFDQAEDVRDLISRAPRPFLFYCDNGNKPLEVETFAPALHVGDFLAVHDLGTEIFAKDIPANFTELLTFGLTGFYAKAVGA